MRKAAAMCTGSDGWQKLKVWHDNEGFLKQPRAYKNAGLTSVLFPPNSGDLNPIETVWARLRKDLAKLEFEDLKHDKVITVASFKRRVAQLLRSYSIKGIGCLLVFQTNKYRLKYINALKKIKALESSTVTWKSWLVACQQG